MRMKYRNKEAALEALHTSGVVEFADSYGIEFWAQIDSKTFEIYKVSTGFESGKAEGSQYLRREGDIIWHTHPSASGVWKGDLASAMAKKAGWVFASSTGGRILDGYQNPYFYGSQSNTYKPGASMSGMKFMYQSYVNGAWIKEPQTMK